MEPRPVEEPGSGAVDSPTGGTAASEGSAATVPVRTGRLAAIGRRLRQPIPGARNRVRFEMPPETESDEGSDGFRPEDDHGFGAPGPRMSSQHPLYVGFMGTAGVGVALAVFYIASQHHPTPSLDRDGPVHRPGTGPRGAVA